MASPSETIAASNIRQPTLRELLETARAVPDIVDGHLAARRMQRRMLTGLGTLAALALVAGTCVLALRLGALLGG